MPSFRAVSLQRLAKTILATCCLIHGHAFGENTYSSESSLDRVGLLKTTECAVSCPPNSSIEGTKNVTCIQPSRDCFCHRGFKKYGEECLTIVSQPIRRDQNCDFSCPAYSYPKRSVLCMQSFDQCRCYLGFYKSNGLCLPYCPIKCPSNAEVRQGLVCPVTRSDCVCKPGYLPQKSSCIRTTPPLLGKKGIGLTLKNATDEIPKLLQLNVSWNYRWGLDRVPQQPSNIEFVPMIWGAHPRQNVSSLAARLNASLSGMIASGQVKRLMGFNEPDQLLQSNMDSEFAASLWPALQSTGLSLVGPSCAFTPSTWSDTFMGGMNRTDGRVDWVGFHWYGAPNPSSFQQSLLRAYNKYGRPLLITEFAPADWAATSTSNNRYSPAVVLSFMKAVIPWLEAQDWIAGYAWFPFSIDDPVGTSSALFHANGTLTACGAYYASVQTDFPDGNQSIEADPSVNRRRHLRRPLR